jgi:hypothetical protein
MSWNDRGAVVGRGKGRFELGSAVALAIVVALWALGANAALAGGSIDVEAERFDREVRLTWSAQVETADSLFGGYQVWRSTAGTAGTYQLLRRFDRRYPVTWTYPPVGPGTERQFIDPDSIAILVKYQINSQGDSAYTRSYLGIQPFNGFPYHYAVTSISECLGERNDTLSVHQPQPEIFTFQRDGDDHYGFEVAPGDTVEVLRTPCRRFNPGTNTPGASTFIYTATVESEIALRDFAIESTSVGPIYPSSGTRGNLNDVSVIPNPYVGSAPWEQPGERKIQFVNLTDQATIRIFTVGGDLVREIAHPKPGSSPNEGAADWDLKNGQGELVESGIYIYQVEEPGGVADVRGRLVIVK